MTDVNKLPNIFENGGLVAIYDFKMEQEEPAQPEDLSLTNLFKRNLEKTTSADNSEETRATKRAKTRYNCSKCTFSTSVSTNLETHMRSHCGMNGKVKCPCFDCTSNVKIVVDHHCSRFHDKPTSSSKDPNNNNDTSKGKELLVDVESISSNKELANNSSIKASRKKNLKVKLVFPSRLKRLLNTRRSATAAKTSNLSQVNANLKTVEKSTENQPSRITTDSEIDVEKLVDSVDLLSRPKSEEKKSTDIGVQTEILSLNNMCQLLEELGKEEKTLRESINKLEADYENGKRSLTAAQLECTSASELKNKLERCLEILGDGHDKMPSTSVFETMRCSAQNDFRKAIEMVEAAAMRLTDLSELKRSQEVVIKELLASKIRLAKIEGMKSVKIAEIEVKKRMELLDKF